MPDPSTDKDGHPIALMLVCDTCHEAVEKFEKLAEGGNVTHPIHDFLRALGVTLLTSLAFVGECTVRRHLH